MIKKYFVQAFCFIHVLLMITMSSCRKDSETKYSVLQGKFIQSVTETGELEAIRASSIIMPRISHRYGYSFKIVGLVEHGSTVEKGDSVVALDPSSVYKYIIQQEERLENAKAKAEKQMVEADNRRRDLEVQLKNEEAAWGLKKLELERMQFESEMKKKVKELEFKKAGLKLNKVKKKLALNPLLEKYDQRINALEIMQRQADIENALDVLQNMVLFSPGNGYFQISYNRRGGQNYKLGDEVYMGAMIAGIPDVSEMKVRSYINETDIRKINEGMRVVIRLDALPDIAFEGILDDISRICTEKSKQKIFTTEITILDNDERLKPGMSVSCEYVLYESDDEVFVPNECLVSEGDKTYLMLKKRNNYRKTEVKTGISNSNHTIIQSKIRPGRELMSPGESADI